MISLFRALLTALVLLVLVVPASAAVEARPGDGDPRLQVIHYDPQQVVAVRGVLGYQMMIEFDPSERIENVAIGDSIGWQVIPSRKANLLFVKPMDHVPPTNMTVITNLRRYNFELTVVPGKRTPGASQLLFSLRFEYPAPAIPVVASVEAPHPPEDVNHAYSYEGSPRTLPARVFDDGRSTYFLFAEGAEYPAIFAVDADRSEAVVNWYQRDGYIVVDRLARGFILRRGKEQTRIFNDGFREAEPGPLSPKPRQKARWFRK